MCGLADAVVDARTLGKHQVTTRQRGGCPRSGARGSRRKGHLQGEEGGCAVVVAVWQRSKMCPIPKQTEGTIQKSDSFDHEHGNKRERRSIGTRTCFCMHTPATRPIER